MLSDSASVCQYVFCTSIRRALCDTDSVPDPGSRRQCLDQMATVALQFDRWHFSWSQCLKAACGASLGSRFRHDTKRLLHCIRMSAALKGGAGKLADIIAQALASVLPTFLQRAFLSDVSGELLGDVRALVPSASLMRRYELSLDAALMLIQRESAGSSEVVRVGWADSSPMKGFDWAWSEFHEIRVRDLVSTFEAVVSLAASVRTLVAEWDLLDAEEATVSWNSHVRHSRVRGVGFDFPMTSPGA